MKWKNNQPLAILALTAMVILLYFLSIIFVLVFFNILVFVFDIIGEVSWIVT